MVLGEPEEVWLSTRTRFECECGEAVSLASRLEVPVPATWEATSFKAKVDCPVPQATSRAQGIGSWSCRKSLIFFITNGWK